MVCGGVSCTACSSPSLDPWTFLTNDWLDCPSRQPDCIFHSWDMDRVRNGGDEPSRVSCGELVQNTLTPLFFYCIFIDYHSLGMYNVTCSDDNAKQGTPKTCCTLEDVPLISKCGTYPPESCLFSLIGNVGAFMVVMICLLRYSQVIELSHSSWLNTVALISGCTNAAGLVVVGNFQVDYAKSLHYIGAGVAFPAGLLFVCLHCILTYHLAASVLDYWVGHLRVSLTAVALISLVLSGVFFIHESFLLQHLAAICEWIFVLDILVYYGTFAYEFGSVSTDTIMAALQSSAARSCKSPGSSSTSTHLNCNPERIAMI